MLSKRTIQKRIKYLTNLLLKNIETDKMYDNNDKVEMCRLWAITAEIKSLKWALNAPENKNFKSINRAIKITNKMHEDFIKGE
jgi:hypothetical protein